MAKRTDTEKPATRDASIKKEGYSREVCQEECKRLFTMALSLNERMVSLGSGLVKDGLPTMVRRAIDTSETEAQRRALFAFCRTWLQEQGIGHEDFRRAQIFSMIAGSDPGIFFPWCRWPSLLPQKASSFRSRLLAALEERLPCRSELHSKLSDFVIRRALGDRSALTPVLCGPPGTGKTQEVLTLAEVLTECGIRTGFVHHPMNQSACGEKNDESVGRLVGTGKQWSNGTTGQIYDAARDHDLVLVFLDEAEKGGNRDFLVALLDPQQPLRDNFVQDIVKQGDLRHKTIFVLAVNDFSGLNLGQGDPLWSRLEPVEVPPYDGEDMTRILDRKIQAGSGPFAADSARIRKLARQALQTLGPEAGLRRIEAEVNEMLYRQIILGERDRQAGAPISSIIPFRSPARGR